MTFFRTLALPLTLLIVAIAFIVNFYPLSLHPNEYTFSSDGDGLKNYYTTLYHVQYGNDITFRGMFYPYGTHLLFGDAIPVFVYTMKALIALFPGLAAYTTGIFNVLLMASFLFSAVLIFKLLEKLSLAPLYAMLATIPMVLMSPQIYRIGGHYGLAYSFLIPAWLLLLWHYTHQPKFRHLVYIFLSCVLAIFIHPYHGLIGMVFFGSTTLVFILHEYFRDKKLLPSLKKNIGPLIAVGLSFVVFMVFMKLTDPEIDRVANPYGMMEYRAKMEGLFVPLWGPVFDGLNKAIRIAVPGFEAYAYVGIPATAFFVVLLISFLLKRFKKVESVKTPALTFMQENTWLRNLFLASMLVYIFAMAYPMRLGMMFLLDIVPPLKQFRSLGRLVWIVNYAIVLCMVVFWWKQFQTGYLVYKSKKVLYVSLLVLGIWYWDVYVHFAGVGNRVGMQENLFLAKNKNKILPAEINYANYQCIAGMRFFQVGSEKMGSGHSGEIEKQAILHSYQSGLPMMDAMMTRLSISKSQKLWSAFAHPALISAVWDDFPDQRNILLLKDKSESWSSDSILVYLKKIHSTDKIDYYELPVGFMKKFHQQYQARVEAYLKANPGKSNYGLHVEFNKDEAHPEQEGIYTGSKEVVLYNGRPRLPDSTEAELSLWVYLNYRCVAMPHMTYRIFDDGRSMKYEGTFGTDASYDLSSGWQRYRKVLPPMNWRDSLSVTVRYENTWINHLEIRPLDSITVYKETGDKRQGSVMVNNYRVR